MILEDNSIQCVNLFNSKKQLEVILKQLLNKLPSFLTSMEFYLNNHINDVVLNMINNQQHNQMINLYNENNTLLSLLMRIKIIQNKVIEIIIDKIIQLSSDGNENREMNELIIKILNHIRWCDVVYDPSKAINLLLGSVPVSEQLLFQSCI